MFPKKKSSVKSRDLNWSMGWRKIRGQYVLIAIFVSLLFLYGVFAGLRSLRQSVLLDKRDRVNILFYQEKPLLLSFGLTDDVNYIATFQPEHKLSIPGGYGDYNIGALGKLSDIEDDDEIIRRSFSSAISAFIDFYVVPNKNTVYIDAAESGPDFQRIKLIQQMFSPQHVSNMSFVDRIYFALVLSKKRESDFIVLSNVTAEGKKKETLFYERGFQKKYKGFFFHQSLREEGISVQLLYSNYPAAVTLSRVIEGEGIRVSDLSELDEAKTGTCTIQHNLKKSSKSVHFLKKVLECDEEMVEVEASDIIIVLGEDIQDEWR